MEFKASHPDEKGGPAVRSVHPHVFFFWKRKSSRFGRSVHVLCRDSVRGTLQVAKAGGEKWRSMTEEERKPYVDQAKELKVKFDSGEGSAVSSWI